VLTDVSVLSTSLNAEDADEVAPLEEDFLIPVARLNTSEPGTVYVAFKNASGASYPSSTFTNILKFTSKEIDPSTGEPEEEGYEDEYQVEDLELGGADWVIPTFATNFDEIWDTIDTETGDEASETLILSGSKSITGNFHPASANVVANSEPRRCCYAVAVNPFPSASGGHRRTVLDSYTYPQAVRQDSQQRESRDTSKDGIPSQGWSNSQNPRSQRGRGSCDSGSWERGIEQHLSLSYVSINEVLVEATEGLDKDQ
jgi:hypothetical protein